MGNSGIMTSCIFVALSYVEMTIDNCIFHSNNAMF